MNNVVVEVLNIEHGKKVIQAFRDKGVFTGTYTGESTKAGGYEFRYYGVVNGMFDTYRYNSLPPEVKIITLEELAGQDEKSFPRDMMLWDLNSHTDKQKRLVLGKIQDMYLATNFTRDKVTKEVSAGRGVPCYLWPHAEEIPAPEPKVLELTLQQVAEKFGADAVKIVGHGTLD